MHLNAYIQNRSKNICKKGTNEEKNNFKKRRIKKGIKKICLSHNQLDEIVTTSHAHVQKTTSQLLSFRMRAHGVYRNTHDKPLISVTTT